MMGVRLTTTRHPVASASSGVLLALSSCGLFVGCVGSGDDSVVAIPDAATASDASDAASDHAAPHDGPSQAGDSTVPDAGSDGEAGAPAAAFNSPINFGAVGCGTAQATQTFDVTNSGGSTLSVTAQVGSNPTGGTYSVTPSGLTIPSGMSGQFTIGLTVPASTSAGATLAGTLVLDTNDPAHTSSTVQLSGTASGATLVVSPAPVGFASTEVGVAESITLQLQNAGNAAASFFLGAPSNSNFTLSGAADAGADGGLGFLLAADGGTSTSVTFLPASVSPAGGFTGSSTITATGTLCGSSAASLSFQGSTATGTLAGWPSNNAIDFGAAYCGGTAPAPYSVTLTNDQSFPVQITGVDTSQMGTAPNNFTTSLEAPASIAAGGGTLTFTIGAPAVPAPSATTPSIPLNSLSGTLVIHTNVDPSPTQGTSIALREEPTGAILAFGTPQTPGCTMSSNFDTFSTPTVLLEPVPPQSFCVTNSGNLSANVTLTAAVNDAGAPPDAGGDAAASNAAPVFAALPSTFTIAADTVGPAVPEVEPESLAFQPEQGGSTTGTLSMAVDQTTVLCAVLPQPVTLSGSAVGGGASVSPTTLTFNATCGGSAPAPQTFVVQNAGNANMNWSMTPLTGPGASLYTVTASPEPGLLAPSAFSTVTVTAAKVPSPAPNPNPAALIAQLTVNTDVPFDLGHVVTLSEVPVGDQLSFATGALAFGQVPITAGGVSQSFTVNNSANAGSADAALTFTIGGGGASAYSGPTFSGGSFAAGGSLSEQVTFDPTAPDMYLANVSISTADPLCTPLPNALNLIGTGTAGAVSLSATSLAFGQPGDPNGLVNCGSTGTTQTLTISNVGNQSFDIKGIALGKASTSPFTLSGPATTLPTVAIGGSTTLTITPEIIPNIVANPQDPSAFSDVLTITTDAAEDLQLMVPLAMQPRGAVIANTPLLTSWNFGTVGEGSIGTFTTTIENTGNAPATVTLQGLLQPTIFGLQGNPATVAAGTAAAPAVTALVGEFAPPLASGTWTDQGELVLTAPDGFCGNLPSQWITPMIDFSGASNASPIVTLAGNLVFPTTDCGGATPGGQSVTLTNSTNRAYPYTVSFASGHFYTLVDSGLGTLAANGLSTIVVNPKAVTPGQGVLPGSAPYADDLVISIATSPTPTDFTIPISWTLNGAVLSLPQGAGPNSDSQGSFYVADSTSGFPLPMANSGTATASVSLAIQPPGLFSTQPAAPLQVVPGITELDELASGPSTPACPATSNGTVTFAYSGPVCQPFAVSSVEVRACTGIYTPSSTVLDAGAPNDSGAVSGTPDAAGTDGGADAGGPTACTTAPCAASGANSVQCPDSPMGNGVCTPTEAALVNGIDIPQGNLTAAGQLIAFSNTATLAGQGSCYTCLNNKSCLDDNQGDTGLECGDAPALPVNGMAGGAPGSGSALCMSTLDCIVQSNCQGPRGVGDSGATPDVVLCYCGANFAGDECQTAASATDGVCVNQEAAGFGFAFSDNKDILGNFAGDGLYASAFANEIFSCAVSNKCSICAR